MTTTTTTKLSPKYRTLSQVIKRKDEDGFRIGNGFHVCGHRMMVCESCSRAFCPDCDFIFPKHTFGCCREALEEYLHAADVKYRKRHPKKREKFKIEIEEIGNEL